jgi:hypothetical protein
MGGMWMEKVSDQDEKKKTIAIDLKKEKNMGDRDKHACDVRRKQMYGNAKAERSQIL